MDHESFTPPIVDNNEKVHSSPSQEEGDEEASKEAQRHDDREHPLVEGEAREQNLKAWFGRSKMANSEGVPLVYYHGTGRHFETFDREFLMSGEEEGRLPQNALGFFFARSRAYGSFYAGFNDPMEVYLRIVRPYRLAARDYVNLDTNEKVTQFLERIKSEGHDGIIIGSGVEIVVFEPEQVKSVKNQGAFSSGDPNIFH
jgi:hypothetical protein